MKILLKILLVILIYGGFPLAGFLVCTFLTLEGALIAEKCGVPGGWSFLVGVAMFVVGISLVAIVGALVESRLKRSLRLTAWLITATVWLGVIEKGPKERILMHGNLSRSEFADLNHFEREVRLEKLVFHLRRMDVEEELVNPHVACNRVLSTQRATGVNDLEDWLKSLPKGGKLKYISHRNGSCSFRRFPQKLAFPRLLTARSAPARDYQFDRRPLAPLFRFLWKMLARVLALYRFVDRSSRTQCCGARARPCQPSNCLLVRRRVLKPVISMWFAGTPHDHA